MKRIFILAILIASVVSNISAQLTESLVLDNTDLETETDSLYTIGVPFIPPSCDCEVQQALLYIKLDLGEDYGYGNNAFDVSFDTIKIKAYSYASPNPIPDRIFSFAIDEENPEAVKVIDITSDYYSFLYAYRIYWYGYSSSSLVEDSVRFTFEIVKKMQCEPKPTTSLVSTVALGTVTINPVTFTWGDGCAYLFDNYEFQLLKLFNNDSLHAQGTGDYKSVVDWNEAMTIETMSSDNTLTLTLAEGSGYYVWRVRPISNVYPGGISNPDNWGKWSDHTGYHQGASVTISGPSGPVFYYNQFNDTINWIYGRTFTEGNINRNEQVRIGENIAFADGLQKIMQEQIHIDSKDSILVTSTLYDYTGRPSLKTIPIPAGRDSLSFDSNLQPFMNDSSDVLYHTRHFDSDTNYFDPFMVYDSTGTHYIYYSNDNTDKFIPDAEKYPFTRTLYESGTGKPREIGSVGETMRITPDTANSHTIKIHYASVTDHELVRMFGDEAPHGSDTYKEITTDQNNSSSVKYFDKSGNLIATCLMENPDINTAIDTTHAFDEEPFEVIATATGDELNGNVISSGTNLMVLEQTEVELSYNLTPNAVEDTCMEYCKTCDHTVHLVVSHADFPDSIVYDTTMIIPFYDCDNIATTDWSRTLMLDPGNYIIYKDLTVMNNDPLSAANLSYIGGYLDSLEFYYDTVITEELEVYIDIINDYGADSLYHYLDNSIDLCYYGENNIDTMMYIPISCDSIGIPLLTCPCLPCEIDPNNPDFYAYYDSLYTNGHISLSSIPNYPGTTGASINDLIANMIDDGYDCDTLWSCWQNVIINADSYMEIAQNEPDYDFDPVNEFLNCTGRMLDGYFLESSATANDYENVHIHFCHPDPNGWSPTGFCEYAIRDNQGSQIDSLDYNDSLWTCYYMCLIYADTSLNFAMDSTGHAIIQTCEQRCDDRRAAFESAIVQLYHNDSIYIESDEFELEYDTTWMYTYIPGATPWDSASADSAYILNKDIQCLVNAMVDYCIEGCQLTPVYNATQDTIIGWGATAADIDSFMYSYVYPFEVAFPSDTLSSEWDTLHTQYTKSEPFEFDDITNFWDSIYGGTNNEKLYDIIETFDHGYLLAGYTESNYDLVNGNKSDTLIGTKDYWLVRLDSDKNKLWDLDIGESSKNACLYSIYQTYDGGFLLGGFLDDGTDGYGEKDYWLVRVSHAGTIEWDTLYGGTGDDVLLDIQQFHNGDVLLTGASESNSSTVKSENYHGTTPNFDFWIIKIEKDGDIIWDKTIGGADNDYAYSAHINNEDQIFITGPSESNTYTHIDGLGKSEDNLGERDYWIVKLDNDSAATTLWDKTIGGSQDDIAYSIIETKHDSVFILGASESSDGNHSDTLYAATYYDYWLVNLDMDGNYIWDRTYGSELNEGNFNTSYCPMQIIETRAGNYLLGGTGRELPPAYVSTTRKDTSNYQTEHVYWIVYIDNYGNYLWDKSSNGYVGENYMTSELQSIKRSFFLAGHSNADIGRDKGSDHFGVGYNYDYWALEIGYDCDSLAICFKWTGWPDFADSLLNEMAPLTCEEVNENLLLNIIDDKKDRYITEQVANFEDQYMNNCVDPGSINDKYEAKYELDYYYYTLYYYDRAGNLVKTVPPEGVNTIDVSALENDSTRADTTNHKFITKYEYNSLGQLIRQITPDGGETNFYYNDVGQLRFSVNAQQILDTLFSYTKYDNLGRVIETGQADSTISGSFMDSLNIAGFPASGGEQRVFTVYTIPHDSAIYIDGSTQNHLINRVSYSYTDDDVYTYYSYDPHGNVEWLIQDIPGLGKNYVAYDYDLVSGNVLRVRYNEGYTDQFYHRYTYDTDNRITKVETSTDNVIWDEDANYEYYLHGPLRRTEIGEDKLQGLDYTYTLQGWLKSINHVSRDSTKDQGRDAFGNYFANDEFAMELNYFDGDFTRSGSFLDGTQNTSLNVTNSSLYNGNITGWAINNDEYTTACPENITANLYKYDQINRLKEVDFKYYYSGSYVEGQSGVDFDCSYTYDMNGNFISLNRNAHKAVEAVNMDELSYTYYNNKNRLHTVTDASTAWWPGALDPYVTYTYWYDSIGNLTREHGNGMDTDIEWNLYGKVSTVDPSMSSFSDLEFVYDAMGNRVMKIITPNDTTQKEVYYYVRDAQGNILSVYRKTYDTSPAWGYKDIYQLEEQYIYGSSRLGVRKKVVDIKEVEHHTGGGTFTINYNTGVVKSELSNTMILAKKPQFIIFPQPSLSLGSIILGQSSSQMQITPTIISLEHLGKREMDVTGESGYLSSRNVELFGQQGNNPCVAEDRYGDIQFTAMTARKVGISTNVCLLYSKQNNLMLNSSGILSDRNRRSMATEKKDSSYIYYFFTIATSGKPYYHTVDVHYNKVKQKNVEIENSTDYGYSMAIAADYTNQFTSRLFLKKYNQNDSCYIMGCTIADDQIGTPEIMARFKTADVSCRGDIKISPNGKYLAVANIETMSMLSTESQILIYRISDDFSKLTYLDEESFDKFKIENFDFSPESDYLYITKISIDAQIPSEVFRYNITAGTSTTVHDIYYGDVFRGKNDTMYTTKGGIYDILEIADPDGTFSYSTRTVESGYWYTQGKFPLQPFKVYNAEPEYYTREIGTKHYEITDHLGNVRLVFSDYKSPNNANDLTDGFYAEVESQNNYYPFGMLMPGKLYNAPDYRFGFNGQEKDDEITGVTGSHLDFGARIYDSRIGKWLSVDPSQTKYPNWSPYNFVLNNPIYLVDPDGKEPTHEGAIGVNAFITLLNSNSISTPSDFQKFYRGYMNSWANSDAAGARYLYSKKWGWVDMKHFSFFANNAGNWLMSDSYLLGRGESHEKQSEKSETSSAWDYEDLPSNMLGVYFEEWSKDRGPLSNEDIDKMIDQGDNPFTYLLREFLNELEFSDNPIEDKPSDNPIPATMHTEVDKKPNKGYTPRYATKKRDSKADKKVIDFAKKNNKKIHKDNPRK